jgi:hypothetical protein
MRWRAWAIAGLVLAAGLVGPACDQKDDVSVESLEARRRAQELEQRRHASSGPAAPTTQQLLTGPKTPLRLGEIPLVMDVPKNWGLQSIAEGSVITVSGPASSGEINIRLGGRGETINAARIDDIVAGFKREADAKPHPINRVEMREIGPLKVLEQRMISSKDFTGGKLPPEVWTTEVLRSEKTGETTTVKSILNPHLVKWNLTVFVPAGQDKFTTRTLSFMTLKVSEYEQDKEFLEGLVKSLRYEE